MEVCISGRPAADAWVTVPPSKSLSHRVLLAAALGEGVSKIHNLADNADTRATLSCLGHFGISAQEEKTGLSLAGHPFVYDGQVLDCGESGSTLRFLIPLAAQTGVPVTFTGHGRLMHRPLGVYEDLFHQRHLLFERSGETLRVCGPLPAGMYEVDGAVSSQFITGLLYALPLAAGDSVLKIRPPFVSSSYVRLTTEVLQQAGIRLEQKDMVFQVPGRQSFLPQNWEVEGDASQAVFFGVLAALSGRRLEVRGLNPHTSQGDAAFMPILQQAGVKVLERRSGLVFQPPEVLQAVTADLEDCPDLGPALFSLAARCQGTSVFTHTARLRVKESDRAAAMAQELGRLGVQVEVEADCVRVHGAERLSGNVLLQGHNDHRIVMALAVLAAGCTGALTIQGAQAVAKSYPRFFADLKQMGMEVEPCLIMK